MSQQCCQCCDGEIAIQRQDQQFHWRNSLSTAYLVFSPCAFFHHCRYLPLNLLSSNHWDRQERCTNVIVLSLCKVSWVWNSLTLLAKHFGNGWIRLIMHVQFYVILTEECLEIECLACVWGMIVWIFALKITHLIHGVLFFPFLASCGIVNEQSLYLVQVLMNCLLSSAPPVATTLKIFSSDVVFHCIFDCAAECFLDQPMVGRGRLPVWLVVRLICHNIYAVIQC